MSERNLLSKDASMRIDRSINHRMKLYAAIYNRPVQRLYEQALLKWLEEQPQLPDSVEKMMQTS